MIAITIFMGPIPAWARSKSDRTFSTEFHHAEKVTTRAQPGPIESNAVPDRPSSLTDYERVAFRSAPESAGPALFGRAQSLATPAHNVGRPECRHNLAHPKGRGSAAARNPTAGLRRAAKCRDLPVPAEPKPARPRTRPPP